MSEIPNENLKRRRGRPKIEVGFIEAHYDSRRATVNKKYMFDGTLLLDYAGDEIPDSKLLYNIDCPINEIVHKDGILEQLGRLYVQDNMEYEDCIYIANLVVKAVKAGAKSRCVENAIRKIRKYLKLLVNGSDSKEHKNEYIHALAELYYLGKK